MAVVGVRRDEEMEKTDGKGERGRVEWMPER